ncbi:MAG: hypothetical protein ABEJ72_09940, partial [Candidatus Aenigmatarchaeota archaeon]
YWNSNAFSANELYTKVMEEDIDAVLSLLNGSKSEEKKDSSIREACRHYRVTYLGEAREELIKSGRKAEFDSIIEYLEETRKNQI